MQGDVADLFFSIETVWKKNAFRHSSPTIMYAKSSYEIAR